MSAYFLSSRVNNVDTADVDSLQRLSSTMIEENLQNQSHQFDVAQITEVTDGVFVAIGYAIANSVIVECDDSLVVIDTTESITSARTIKKDLFALRPHLQHKKVKHVVYTHYHPDHTFGTKGWIDDEKNPPVIIAHPQTSKELERILSLTSTITQVRAQRQFGTILKKLQDDFGEINERYGFSNHEQEHVHAHAHEHEHSHRCASLMDEDEQLRMKQMFQNDSGIFVNSGIGPFLVYGDPFDRSMFYPTLILNRSVEILNLDGVTFEFYHAPGETVDQIFIHLPQKRVLMPADNIYRAFPNIYAIRGSPTRPAREWVNSIDAMRALLPAPKFLVPHHTQPVYGEETIYDVLTSYRDGIAFVHDQTIRYINLGYVPDDIVVLVRQSMPHRLLTHPFLQEFYGTIDWSVRAIFQAYLGWFSGDPVDLFPLPKQQQARRIAKMVSSPSVMIETAEDNLLNHETRDDCQWALQLSDAVLSLSTKQSNTNQDEHVLELTREEKSKAFEIKIKALQCLASYMTSANGRNYYLTSAYESIRQKRTISVFANERDREWVSLVVPMEQLFHMLPVRFKANEMRNFNLSMCFHFTDLQEFYMLMIRDGIVEIWHDSYEENDIKILNDLCIEPANSVSELTSQDFRALVAADAVKGALLYTQGRIKIVKGSVLEFSKFRGYFETR